MTKDDEVRIQVELDNVFKLVNDWLKYSEQKLTGLIALNAGILWGYSRFLSINCNTPDISVSLNVVAYSFVILSLIVCIIAKMPVLNKQWFTSKVQSESDNSIYFGDIQKYNHIEYLQLLNNRTGVNQDSFTDYEKDQAKQVVYNAEIVTRKFNIAKFSSWVTLLAISTFTTAFLIAFYG
ncbi:Pycsar system effector family protein [Idiomarina piscisalsi]|uniref:Pycsar system effector family protein n=1 Tax=Idiomarina piscisalsi TaxID=1096243 RepID=UPI00137CD443|nr:Pycsar system effector family protein [Idiomarina piscisalsi]MTJ02667.1 hypothetical protein [Idiomarina piscisalsi]